MESFELASDERNFSIMDFKSNGEFISSGQFTIHQQGTDHPIVMDDQRGTYFTSNDTIFAKVLGLQNEMIMKYRYTNNKLILQSEPMILPEHSKFTANQTFITISTYIKSD
ncbi:hypothetical protein H8S90_16030 [Olivibacter sp. SDN3]|uniref:hypothetical protein n=1 Tax=Olivibacter sp. SDN3 TaxID=2764720 RepID=UPI001650F4A4|nr:hypothetical protein [Olivibacter sp. SDN3]QNL48298.1 hypothetical protein H8S90_16030 [Olivibacter sp. SDN3]